MEYLPLVIGGIGCAIFAIRAVRLLHAALWLAGVSVVTALLLYRLGAREIAIIELSVGAGLVTVLFVFAIAILGDKVLPLRSIVRKPVAALLTAAALILLGLLLLPISDPLASTPAAFPVVFWQDRALDAVLQVFLIFAGVLGVMGLLDAPRAAEELESAPVAEEEVV
ncbi:MAG: DUF4040 domain-containing protein [Anaerolinea sp.]|nr:DUF4040 domain-containing protein [Anaerolinea sp.]